MVVILLLLYRYIDVLDLDNLFIANVNRNEERVIIVYRGQEKMKNEDT